MKSDLRDQIIELLHDFGIFSAPFREQAADAILELVEGAA